MLNHKKVLSVALAGAMAASLAVPACAATTSSNTTKVTGVYQAVTINVDVPSTGDVIINPYGLPVAIGKDADDKDVTVKGLQIVTKPLTIKNKTDVKLDVNVSATASVTGAFTFATAPIATPAEDTKNDGFVYVDIEASTLAGDADTVSDAAIATAWKDISWTAYDTSTVPANTLALKATTTALTKAKMGTLAAATLADGEFSAYTAGSIAYVGLCGQVAQNPKTAWVAKDGFVANLAFTFTPNTES
jgi:hypothetical protein